jgi:hypothetical protein
MKIMALISMFLLLATPFSSFTALSDAELPQWMVGDKWTYNSISHSVTRTLTVEVTDISTVNVNGTDYDVYVVETSTAITVENNTYTTIITNYIIRSTFETVKTEFAESDPEGLIYEMTMTYSPPRKDYDFPLEVGKTWYSNYTEILFDGFDYNNISMSISYLVTEIEYLTLEVGTFECYKIEVNDGMVSTYYNWYSPDVNNTVEATIGTDLFLPLELTSYTISGGGDGDGDSEPAEIPYLLLLIPIIIAVILVVMIILKKKSNEKKKKKKKKKKK